MSTPEVPFEPDYQVTSEAYLRYCAGLAVAQTPFDTISIHHFDDVERDADNIWGIAENIMTSSIRSIIKAVRPPDSHTHAKHSYEQNLPFLFRALDAAFETHTDKITTINPWYPILRPAPFLHKSTFPGLAVPALTPGAACLEC